MITPCLFCSCDVFVANPGISSGIEIIEIPVNSDCIDRKDLVYNLARLLGLPDEYARPDRDKFLTIHWDNIKSSKFIYII